ncbi:hypothetical protein [Specibacter cremeus]|uniref:hypothetical protein n=1 Tax=Specibacter cremeus TaxID=1629051 RepID=UPI000F76E332|nr:hypothetical protein [Specibacter cremeus]
MDPDLATLSVQDLAGTLGSALLSILTRPDEPDLPVSVPVVYDSRDVLADTPGGILLLVGLDPSAAESAAAIDAAAERGFCAAVIKLRGNRYQELADRARQAGVALLALDDEVPWRQLDSLVSAMTNSRGSEDAGAGTDLFMLANALATAADGAVAIEDLDRNVLAYSNLERHTVDRLRRNGILARRVPEEEKNTWQYRTVMATKGVVHFPFDPADGELARCAAPVRAGRRTIGSIWVIEDEKPISAEAEAALMETARLAAIAILRQQNAVDLEHQMRAEWLRSALEGPGSAPATAGRFGMVPTLPSVVVAFMFRTDREGGTQPLIRELTTAAEQYCGVFRSDPDPRVGTF